MNLDAQDVSAIISATGAMVSAIMATLAFVIQIKGQKTIDKEKEELSKARFYETGWYRNANILSIRVENRNPSPVYDIVGVLQKNKNVEVSISNPSTNDACDFEVKMDFSSFNESISDVLIMKYKNIYGKEFESSKNIFIPIGTNEKTNLGNKYFFNN